MRDITDMDLPVKIECLIVDYMVVEDRGKRDRVEEEDFKRTASSSSNFALVKSKSQLKREHKKKNALAKAHQKVAASRPMIANPT